MGLRRYIGRKKRWTNLTKEIKRRGINCYQKESQCDPNLLVIKYNERDRTCYKNPNIKSDSPLGNLCKRMDIEIEQLEKIRTQDNTCNLCDEYLRTKRMPSKKERKRLNKYQAQESEASLAAQLLPSVPRDEPENSNPKSLRIS